MAFLFSDNREESDQKGGRKFRKLKYSERKENLNIKKEKKRRRKRKKGNGVRRNCA